jgi:hypothetical protein
MEGIFDKQVEMRGHILAVEFLTLDPNFFDNIQYLFTKYKDLLSKLKVCGVDKSKEEKQMVLNILSKLGMEYLVFVSKFHSVRLASVATWKIPSLEVFIESLTQEQNKLINMGKIKGLKVHALVVQYGSSHQNQKYKKNTKGRNMKIHRRKGTQNPSTIPPDPKVEREEKGRNALTSNKDPIENLHACRNI